MVRDPSLAEARSGSIGVFGVPPQLLQQEFVGRARLAGVPQLAFDTGDLDTGVKLRNHIRGPPGRRLGAPAAHQLALSGDGPQFGRNSLVDLLIEGLGMARWTGHRQDRLYHPFVPRGDPEAAALPAYVIITST